MHTFKYELNNQPKKTVSKNHHHYQSAHAKFLGWQPTPSGEVVALFNIIDRDHPRYGSTVTENTLQNLNLRVPSTPAKPPSFPLFKFPKK
jgi:hypothetical protein